MNIALAIKDYHRSCRDLDLAMEDRFKVTIRNLCGLFVSVIDQKVNLIHQTAKEFLVAKSKAINGRGKHSIHPAELELLMARTCVTYLMFTVFDDNLHKRQTENHGYFAYAASFWATHYSQG
jgi:hypothetical protein